MNFEEQEIKKTRLSSSLACFSMRLVSSETQEKVKVSVNYNTLRNINGGSALPQLPMGGNVIFSSTSQIHIITLT